MTSDPTRHTILFTLPISGGDISVYAIFSYVPDTDGATINVVDAVKMAGCAIDESTVCKRVQDYFDGDGHDIAVRHAQSQRGEE